MRYLILDFTTQYKFLNQKKKKTCPQHFQEDLGYVYKDTV